MICGDIVAGAFQAAASQPADVYGCGAVILTGTDTSALSLFAFPATDDAAAVWFIGFSMVVISWLLAKGVGIVVNFLDSVR